MQIPIKSQLLPCQLQLCTPQPPTMPRNEVLLASDAPCPGPQVRRGRPPRAAAQPPSNLFIPLHNVYYILLYAPNVVHSKNISATVPAFPAMPHGNMKVKHLSHLIPVRHRGKRWHRCGNNFSFRPDPSPKKIKIRISDAQRRTESSPWCEWM